MGVCFMPFCSTFLFHLLYMKKMLLPALLAFAVLPLSAQKKSTAKQANPVAAKESQPVWDSLFKTARFRNIGPFRGGRSVTATGVPNQPLVYYMGTTGGGVWKTIDAGQTWNNISDGYFKTGSVGAVAVAPSDANVVYVGMGEHAPRGVMTSYGDGVYKSTDAGKTWTHLGLALTRHISWIRIHPQNPDIVYVAAQGALHGPNEERGVYKSVDGGKNWKKVLYVDNNTGCADLDLDANNPRILYAAMWDHRRLPWEVRSGGKGSGLYKSTDGGDTWVKMQKGLPTEMGKMSVSVSRANSETVYALIESDTEKETGGLFASHDAGKNWSRVSDDHRLTQRAWYYIEVFADPQEEQTVYVLNSPGLKSTDGGKTWNYLSGTHGDYHQLWINPSNNKNMIIANDGGAAITFNGGKVWSTQDNQPTAQFYRVNADNLFPYNIYGGQQDNSSVKIQSRNPGGWSIGERNWTYSAGGESAFLAFNPDDPKYVVGGSYQGTIEIQDAASGEGKYIMPAPIQYQALQPKDMKYRFNWNAPIVWSKHEPNTFYHAGNVLFKTKDFGKSWEAISPDLTTHDTSKMGISGTPYTNEGAGGENYCTIAYVTETTVPGVIWTGSDDGVLSLTKDGGKTWARVGPADLGEALINCIEVSPHDPATVFIAATKYKFNDFQPLLYVTNDEGKTWRKITNGIPYGAYTRCIREDAERKGLLFAGTETGLYISFDGGAQWQQTQMGLPITPITDLKVHQGDLLAATMGRSFWILDDLHLLRQYNATKQNQFALFTPENAYRVSGGSYLDRSLPEEAYETPWQGRTGLNPASGVVLHYQLPDTVKSDATLTLTIRDAKGEVVRTYSTSPDKNFVGDYPGGPSSDPLLSTKPGINRFVWDLRYPTVNGVDGVFIEGMYEGHRAIPGQYSAVLTYGTQSATTSFQLKADPRIKASEADYQAQHQLASKVEASVNTIHASITQMRKVRNQLTQLQEQTKEQHQYGDLHQEIASLIKDINLWEAELVQTKAKSNDDIINYVNKLTADYIFLKGEMDANIPYVTKGQETRYQELDTIWQKHAKVLNELKSRVKKLNERCAALQVPVVAIQ